MTFLFEGLPPDGAPMVWGGNLGGWGYLNQPLTTSLLAKTSVKTFGAKGDGVTDDTAAIQTAINSVNSGGILGFPAGVYICASGLSCDLTSNVTLQGLGGLTFSNYTSAPELGPAISEIRFTGIAGLTAHSSLNLTIDNLAITFNNNSFTTDLIDLTPHAAGNDPTARPLFRRCYLGGVVSGTTVPTSARSCINLNGLVEGTIDDCMIRGAQVGITGFVSGSLVNYSNVLNCSRTVFYQQSITCIANTGVTWNFNGCTFEPLANGQLSICKFGQFSFGAGMGSPLVFRDCWSGDTSAAGSGSGFVMDVSGCSIFVVDGCLIDVGGNNGYTYLNLASVAMASVKGTAFNVGSGKSAVLCSLNTSTGFMSFVGNSYGAISGGTVTNLVGRSAVRPVQYAFGDYAELFSVSSLGSMSLGTTGMTTTNTDGFPYIPAAAGAPTGVPTAVTGYVPMYYDTTNHKIWFYDGTWKGVVVA